MKRRISAVINIPDAIAPHFHETSLSGMAQAILLHFEMDQYFPQPIIVLYARAAELIAFCNETLQIPGDS